MFWSTTGIYNLEKAKLFKKTEWGKLFHKCNTTPIKTASGIVLNQTSSFYNSLNKPMRKAREKKKFLKKSNKK